MCELVSLYGFNFLPSYPSGSTEYCCPGVILPFYDEESSLLYLAGKGDGNIRYYEVISNKDTVNHMSTSLR